MDVYINGTQEGVATGFTGNTATISLNNYLVTTSPANLVVLVNYIGNSAGTYQFSITGLTGTSANNGGQLISVVGLPLNVNTVNCQQATSTPTNTFTYTFTNTPTFTPTGTFTTTVTATPTFTFTVTSTGTITPTFTQTPVPLKVPVVYPNPADGTSPVAIRPPVYTGNSVTVEIYTVAYRKVFNHTYGLNYGNDPKISLVDNWNNPLASGLYYVVVTTNSGRSIGKLLVLR